MSLLARTLYGQIAWLHLLLLLAFCLLAIIFTARQFDAFLAELEQRLNRDLARNLVNEFRSDFRSGIDSRSAVQAMERVKAINPALDIYVLNEAGLVTASFADDSALEREQIDLEPIRAFLEEGARLPIRAGDPGDGEQTEVFSAAVFESGIPHAAYLYVILRGMSRETMAGLLRTSYIARGIAGVLAIVLLSTVVVGLILFALLTRRFRRLTTTVMSFKQGAYDGRAAVDADDEIGRLGRAFNDMAATIEAQVEALERTDEARRSLIANVSHDFRTPLTSLRGYTERLLHGEDRLDAQQRRECLEVVLDNTSQLEHLTEQLLVLAQLDINSSAARFEAFSMAELVQDVCVKFMPVAERSGVALEAHYEPDLRLVSGDIGLIERALSNLVDNALINTPRGGKVDMAAHETGEGLRVSVSDTGWGIEADELPLVTQRFYRTRQSRSSHRAGSGLGLAITRDIVELHGGSLHLESRVGAGTTAMFTLPAAS